jgi:N-acetylneuraminate synthase
MPDFIAEISSNHNRDLGRALELIDVAAEIGCQGVKFQLFELDKLFHPWALARKAELQQRRDWELPVEYIPVLARRARERKLQFACTPFYLHAVRELEPYVDFYKVASYQILWHKLLDAIARTGKPIVLSTGMATIGEVRAALSHLQNFGCPAVTLLHCVSSYPVQPDDCNLNTIEYLRDELNTQYPFLRGIGWSDHSVNLGVVAAATLQYRAALVEFHLDLADAKGVEYQIGHCWTPDAARAMITLVRAGLQARGHYGKNIGAGEYTERMWRTDPEDGLRPLKEFRK